MIGVIMDIISEKKLTGERALFASHGIKIVDCVFDEGESPLKESSDLEIERCIFGWKYPLWYCKNVSVKDTNWLEMGRAGVWYTDNVKVTNAVIQAPKNFRRCKNVELTDVAITKAEETFWNCDSIRLKNVTAKGNYFAMNSKNIEIDGLKLDGNYSFDGCENVVVRNSTLMSKDAFWNCKNVTVYDSFISGEYLGWNSENLTLVNCTIESLQGMCYIDNLKMENCRLINTTLAFEYSKVEADISSRIDSVFNPSEGRIKAEAIGELILEKDQIDPTKTKIECKSIEETSDVVEWRR